MINQTLLTAASLLSLLNPVTQVVTHPMAVPAYAAPAPEIVLSEDLHAKADRIAKEHGIATTTLSNLITSESNWNPQAEKNGDRGLAQINSKYWPEISDTEAYDPDFALNFAASQIKENQGIHFVSCNCVAFLRVMGVHFPRLIDAKNLDTNSQVPVKGGIVKLVYDGIYHLAYIESVEEDGIHIREANYSPCKIGKRVLDFNDPRIIGFYTDKI